MSFSLKDVNINVPDTTRLLRTGFKQQLTQVLSHTGPKMDIQSPSDTTLDTHRQEPSSIYYTDWPTEGYHGRVAWRPARPHYDPICYRLMKAPAWNCQEPIFTTRPQNCIEESLHWNERFFSSLVSLSRW